MAKNLKKSIITMMVAFVCMSANAQSVNTATVDTLTQTKFEALKAEKVASRVQNVLAADSITVVRTDSVVRKLVDGKIYEWTYTKVGKPAPVDTVSIMNPAIESKLYAAQVDGRVVDKLLQPKDKKGRDVVYAQVDGLKGVSATDPDAGKIPLLECNTDGLSVGVFGGYQIAEGANSPIMGGGFQYTYKKIGVYLNGEVMQREYTSNAERAGEKYWSFAGTAGFKFAPFKFGPLNQFRGYIFAGAGLGTYESDSKIADNRRLTSWGANEIFEGGISLDYRFFGKGTNVVLDLKYRRYADVLQNKSNSHLNAFVMTLRVNTLLIKNKVNNVESLKNLTL